MKKEEANRLLIEDPTYKAIESDIDFILEGKKIDIAIKNKVLNIMGAIITRYSHDIITEEKNGKFGKGIFGHIVRKDIRRDYMRHAYIYLDKLLNAQEVKNG